MINSTRRCVRAWCLVTDGLLTQRLIIMKHMLSLHIPEPHQLERGLRWLSPPGMSVGAKQAWRLLDTSVEYAGTVWGHVRTEMIKVATMRIKHRGYAALISPQRQTKKEAVWLIHTSIKCVYTAWDQLLGADWIHFVVCLRQKYLQHWWTFSSKVSALIWISTSPHAGFQTKTNLLHHDKHIDYAITHN